MPAPRPALVPAPRWRWRLLAWPCMPTWRMHANLPCSPSSFPSRQRRYAYTSYRPYARRLREIQAEHQRVRDANGTAPPASLPHTVPALEPGGDDAFGVIMAWLYTRIPATR